MSETKKYYWLKLKRDFFKRHDIEIIEGMPNGKDYVLFYLKLLVESIDHEGALRFSETLPYNEEMLATITRTNVDIVRSAVKIFYQLGMMDMMDDGTLYMRPYVDKRVRTNKEYKRWRHDVFARDNYTCNVCGKRGGKLNAHHIKPWAKYKDLRFDVSNGITLCVKCHKMQHFRKGI